MITSGLTPGEEFELFFNQGKKRYGPEPEKVEKRTAAKHADTFKIGDLKLEPATDGE